MQSMTISVETAGVRVAIDLLEGAGPEEIQEGLDLMLQTVRSQRYRALVGVSRQLAPAPVSLPVPVMSTVGNGYFPAFDVAPPPDPSEIDSSPSDAPMLPPGVLEFRAVEKKAHSESGEVTLRAMPVGSTFSQYGIKLPDALKTEYMRRAGLSELKIGANPHRVVLIRVGEFQKEGKTYPKLESFYDG